MMEKLSNSPQQKLLNVCYVLVYSFQGHTSCEQYYVQGLLSRSFTSYYLTKDHLVQIQKNFPSLTFVFILPFKFFTTHSSLRGSVKDLGLWSITNLDLNTSSATCMFLILSNLPHLTNPLSFWTYKMMIVCPLL